MADTEEEQRSIKNRGTNELRFLEYSFIVNFYFDVNFTVSTIQETGLCHMNLR